MIQPRRVFDELAASAQRGSKPRCHLLTDGSPRVVAERLTEMAYPFATVGDSDRWMPQGFSDCAEAELDKAHRLLDAERRRLLARWWLQADASGARTPNFDIASTCTIGGEPGLLLIEAKAHAQELIREECGRLIPPDASEERRATHPGIKAAIDEACLGLAQSTGRAWGISRDSHYQMSNRFAWSWKLTALGVPVVLAYLGFLSANEMADRGRPIGSPEEWTNLVLQHSKPLFPADIWGRAWNLNGRQFAPIIVTSAQPLARGTL